MSALCPLRPSEPDCRDFLRTGRCKYGESCKYNHPPEVESGGGVKPADPSEPFPVRPTEPPCQYFLKHGTCKFGQACKFNHPSGHSPVEDVGGSCGGSLFPSGHLVFLATNSSPAFMTTDVSHFMTSSTSVQVLPQRPNEPNCIYYLRNGKCRYGATCKFHHPLDAPSRNNQLYHAQTTNTRPSQSNARDMAHSASSLSQPHQQSVPHATASNVSYLMSQRLQPIRELVRPHQPTHVLLPSGQIAVILDPLSLQKVSELNPQDRPKYYISQTDGSVGELPSKYQNNNPVPVISPMLTATTHSISSTTFDSCIDLNHQGHTSSRSPKNSGSAGSLSAHGSVDSWSHAQGDVEYSQQTSGQGPLEQGPINMGRASFPQYSAWPIHEGHIQSNQAQVRRSPSSVDTTDRQRHVTDLEITSDSAADYYWPSSGSLSSIRTTDHDIQAGRSQANFSPYQISTSAGQVARPSFTAERNSYIAPSSSSEQMLATNGNKQDRQESPGTDEGLTMMTSALLTMMDRHDYHYGATNGSTHVDANIREKRLPTRPPPGMISPPGMLNINPGGYSYSSNFEEQTSPPGGEGYFLGGYDEQPSRSPP